MLAEARKHQPDLEPVVRACFHATYDGSLAYRVIYNLRNVLVHGSSSLLTVGGRSRLEPDETLSAKLWVRLHRQRFLASSAKPAVRSELGRAARNPGRRQLGAQLAERDARHRALRRALRDSDARAATLDATSHGRSCDPAIADAIQDIATQHEALLAALETERAQVDALLRDYQADLSREREQVTAPVNPWEQDPMMPIAPDQNRPARGL